MSNNWNTECENYLRNLSKTAGALANRYKLAHSSLLNQEKLFKLPSIGLSGVVSLMSMLNLSVENTVPINAAVGALSLLIATITSCEAYLRISQNATASAVSSHELTRLKEKIDLELSLSVSDRTNDGVIFVKEVHAEYDKIMELAPKILHKNRFVIENDLSSSVSIDLKVDGSDA